MTQQINPTDLASENLNDLFPAAPAGFRNVFFQADQGFPIRSKSANYPNVGDVAKVLGTSYTLALSDRGKLIVFLNVAAVTVTLPAFPNGQVTSAVIRNGGSNYVPGDTFTIVQAGETVIATGNVAAVNTGVVTAVTITNPGAGYRSQLNAGTTTNSLLGTGLTLDITAETIEFMCFVLSMGTAGATFVPSTGTINLVPNVAAAMGNGGVLFFDGTVWWAEGGGIGGAGGGSGVTILVNGS